MDKIQKPLFVAIILAFAAMAVGLTVLVVRAGKQTSLEVSSVKRWGKVEDFEKKLAIHDSVFWEPLDTQSLRKRIRETSLVHQKRVLEIGTGSGLVALCCLKAGAAAVVATDINPAAVACARSNAQRQGLAERLEVRLVSKENPRAFAVLREDEQFDLILTNPPWEDARPKYIDQYALYDPNFELMQSLFDGMEQHLAADGEVYLAYGCKTAIRRIIQLASERNFELTILDDREFDELPELFLPGMLMVLKPKHPE